MKAKFILLFLILTSFSSQVYTSAQGDNKITSVNLTQLTSQLIIGKDNPATYITSFELTHDLAVVTYGTRWDADINSCEVWSIPTQERILYEIKSACAVNAKHTQLAVSRANGNISLYTLPEMILENEIDLTQIAPIQKLRFSPDSTLLAIGLADTQTVVWDIATETEIALLDTRYHYSESLSSKTVEKILFNVSFG